MLDSDLAASRTGRVSVTEQLLQRGIRHYAMSLPMARTMIWKRVELNEDDVDAGRNLDLPYHVVTCEHVALFVEASALVELIVRDQVEAFIDRFGNFMPAWHHVLVIEGLSDYYGAARNSKNSAFRAKVRAIMRPESLADSDDGPSLPADSGALRAERIESRLAQLQLTKPSVKIIHCDAREMPMLLFSLSRSVALSKYRFGPTLDARDCS